MQKPDGPSSYKGFIFDLDGTLLDTLPDLVYVTNLALAKEGFPARTEQEILTFIGNGAFSLVLQATPDYATEEQSRRAYQAFRNLYGICGMDRTRQFNDMQQTLESLKAKGCLLGIMSNKFEQGVKDIEQRFFPQLFTTTHGETEAIPRKPDPTGLLLCAQEMNLEPNQCIYIGDSKTDMTAAHRAGMLAVGVTWGYQSLDTLNEGSPDVLIENPSELLCFAKE